MNQRFEPFPAAVRGLLARLTGFCILCIALVANGPVLAQSSGLKLGEEAPEPTLDLGAGPADSPAAEAPAATAPSSEPAAPETSASGGAVGLGSGERTAHGDWEVACGSEAEGGCAMAQIGNDSTGTPVLEMVIRQLDEPLEVNETTAVAVLDVITPLGVVLTEGLTMKIDQGRDEAAAFQICTEQGCLVREPVADELIKRLKRGSVAKITVFAANQGEVSSSISLKGFTKAYDSIR